MTRHSEVIAISYFQNFVLFFGRKDNAFFWFGIIFFYLAALFAIFDF